MAYMSESAKVRDMPHIMKYITGKILDLGCGPDKITPDAFGIDGRQFPGVDFVCEDMEMLSHYKQWPDPIPHDFDTLFSSHTLEHFVDQWGAIYGWGRRLVSGGYLVLYLPDGRHYDNKENLEHMVDMRYDDFMFWFRRSFCGEGKNYKGEHRDKMFELVDSGMDVGDDRYSFYVIARKV